jgi:3-deoxy-D-manno-octulosonic-acid transferase
VVTGPYTHNFEETFRVLLAAQGEGLVHSADELSTLAAKLIDDPGLARRMGEKALAATIGLGGALKKSIDVAETLLARHARA